MMKTDFCPMSCLAVILALLILILCLFVTRQKRTAMQRLTRFGILGWVIGGVGAAASVWLLISLVLTLSPLIAKHRKNKPAPPTPAPAQEPKPAPAVHFCPKCGTRCKENAIYCPGCGHKLK